MSATQPVPRRWSQAEYYRMGELGLFNGQRTELIDGEIVVVNPQKHSHYVTIDRVAEQLTRAFGHGYWVRTQAPLSCHEHTEPEPDISVVRGARDEYRDHPTTAQLVVEVSDTTLEYDRNEKMSLYAQAGIGEYWIVNLVDQQVEVYCNPAIDSQQPFGYGYSVRHEFRESESVTPTATPQETIAVSNMLLPKVQ